mgnify:FL=1
MKKIISIIMALAMLVTPVNITSVKADQIYNIEKSSKSQITENKIEKLISSQKADIRTGTVKIENKKLESISLPRANYGTINQAATTLKKAMLAHQSTLYVFVKSKSSAADQIYYDIEDKAASVTDNPVEGDYMFWDISNRDVSYRAQKSNGYYLYQFLIKIKYFTTLEQRSLVDDKVNQIIEELGFTSETTDYEKVKAVYDYVCKHVTYAKSLDDEIVFTAYSALYNGEAVCQGYAQLIYRILKQLGISVRVIPGYGKDKTVRHGWNIVKLGDYYYNLDATWDSQLSQAGIRYRYFLKGDNFKDHTRDDQYKNSDFYRNYPMAASDYISDGQNEQSEKTKNSFFENQKTKIKNISKNKIKLKKIKGATGYKIQYSTNKKFKKKVRTIKTKKTTYKIKKLKKGKTYYIRYKAYKNSSEGQVSTDWSKTKKIKLKK